MNKKLYSRDVMYAICSALSRSPEKELRSVWTSMLRVSTFLLTLGASSLLETAFASVESSFCSTSLSSTSSDFFALISDFSGLRLSFLPISCVCVAADGCSTWRGLRPADFNFGSWNLKNSHTLIHFQWLNNIRNLNNDHNWSVILI